MKSFNIKFTSKSLLKNFINSNYIFKSKSILVQIFDGVCDSKKAVDIASYISSILPSASIIGASTAGEISEGKMHENSIIISFTIFDKTNVNSSIYTLDHTFCIKKLEEELIADNTKVLIILSDGLNSDAEILLKNINKIKSDMVIAGGRAGDNYNFKRTYVFNENGYIENGCVIASLNGDDLIANGNYMFNWTPIGKDMVVTKSKKNILYELDGVPVLDIYRKYLGRDISDNMPKASIEFPLIIKKENFCVARDPIMLQDDGALVFAGNFEEGDVVRFSFGNIEDIAMESQESFNKFSKIPTQSIFVYSCAARKSLLKNRFEDELNVLESISDSVGFFTYGEYFHTSKVTEILNVTTTFLSLSETDKVEKKVLIKIETKNYDVVKKALTHLIKLTTKELEEVSTHDSLTTIYNRSEYIKEIKLKIKTAQRYGVGFGLILIDIDDFKLVNDCYGHDIGDLVLVKLSSFLRNNLRDDDFVARWGGEEFVIVVNQATIKSIETLTKKLQKKLEKISFKPVSNLTLSFGLTTYRDTDTKESIFKRVDNAMYSAKDSGKNCYVID